MTTHEICLAARRAAVEIACLPKTRVSEVLCHTADCLMQDMAMLLSANAEDVAAMEPTNPMIDRLRLTEERVKAIADDMRSVSALPSPVGESIEEWMRPNGMTITKRRVPLGVVGVIYEARPNVTFDVFSLCFKTGNASVLKGGSDAARTNRVALDIIRRALSECGVTTDAVALLEGREATEELLHAVGLVDVVIPRGSASLIRYVRENAQVPVIETGAGVVHTYFDKDGDLSIGIEVVNNAKTRRVSVCNALDSLVVHSDRLPDLPALCNRLADSNVVIYADPLAYEALAGHYPSELLCKTDAQSFGTEFLDYKMSIKVVDSAEEAMEHIARYSSGHSECIVTDNEQTASAFTARIDAACVYVNVSTAFTDGGQFGFGAEIGISTQKLHARGPMALRELTTYKYIITGRGQIRRP
ncbi:MAG: glutamate-5-semialdehyde dehydrogenase [Rikenellaceae bacterium]|nr:glutamate-5-semialdehyde dehydrogenase [Rikenellaceae bacterium]MBR2452330.1 glutamate-5-semialdehyde dehydrogenase [Rikenellaceae bacterium]